MKKSGTPSDSLCCQPMCSEGVQTWMDKETAACKFQDERLKKRFRLLLEQFWTSMGQSIPFACQDWASTKAAYRFFTNDHVSEQDILDGHFQATSKFKGCNALKKSINPTRVFIEEKESYRWLENLRQSTALLGDPQRCVHIGDRESDIYELFCTAQEVERTSLSVPASID